MKSRWAQIRWAKDMTVTGPTDKQDVYAWTAPLTPATTRPRSPAAIRRMGHELRKRADQDHFQREARELHQIRRIVVRSTSAPFCGPVQLRHRNHVALYPERRLNDYTFLTCIVCRRGVTWPEIRSRRHITTYTTCNVVYTTPRRSSATTHPIARPVGRSRYHLGASL